MNNPITFAVLPSKTLRSYSPIHSFHRQRGFATRAILQAPKAFRAIANSFYLSVGLQTGKGLTGMVEKGNKQQYVVIPRLAAIIKNDNTRI